MKPERWTRSKQKWSSPIFKTNILIKHQKNMPWKFNAMDNMNLGEGVTHKIHFRFQSKDSWVRVKGETWENCEKYSAFFSKTKHKVSNKISEFLERRSFWMKKNCICIFWPRTLAKFYKFLFLKSTLSLMFSYILDLLETALVFPEIVNLASKLSMAMVLLIMLTGNITKSTLK